MVPVGPAAEQLDTCFASWRLVEFNHPVPVVAGNRDCRPTGFIDVKLKKRRQRNHGVRILNDKETIHELHGAFQVWGTEIETPRRRLMEEHRL